MHSSIKYTGCNLPYVQGTLASHFSEDSFKLVKVKQDLARIEVAAGDVYFSAGDTLHIKKTSILVEKHLEAA